MKLSLRDCFYITAIIGLIVSHFIQHQDLNEMRWRQPQPTKSIPLEQKDVKCLGS